MTRIHVTGNAGSGKTTLAAEIGAALNVPVFGLDEIVWLPGWLLNPAEPRAAAETELISRPMWIIDGVSRRVRNAADIVIFLDEPRRICLFRCARRNWRFLFRSRPGLPANCPELLILPRLVSIIWKFPKRCQTAHPSRYRATSEDGFGHQDKGGTRGCIHSPEKSHS